MTPREGSLWSPEIKPEVLSPRSILESQAESLREQSGGLLAAELKVSKDTDGAVTLALEMHAPSLQEHRHRVLTARYFAERIYPCHIDANGLRSAEVAHSADEFLELLRQVLHSGEVKSLAQSLISRVSDSRRSASHNGITRRDNGHRRAFRPAWAGVDLENDGGVCVETLYDERSVGD
jgi:hypothetical protein